MATQAPIVSYLTVRHFTSTYLMVQHRGHLDDMCDLCCYMSCMH
jgi:hypothetical protein